jgi:hypothetical protein
MPPDKFAAFFFKFCSGYSMAAAFSSLHSAGNRGKCHSTPLLALLECQAVFLSALLQMLRTPEIAEIVIA